MKRNFADILFAANEQQGYQAGDEAAHRAAAAMADRFDAPTIIALTDAMSFLERVGGQFHIVTLRRKVDAIGQPVGEDESGDYRTEAIRLVYESRDGRIVEARPPEEILGVPVTDFGQPPTRIEIDAPVAPEDEVCAICGREDPDDLPENPPCVCQGSAVDDETAPAASPEPEPALTE